MRTSFLFTALAFAIAPMGLACSGTRVDDEGITSEEEGELRAMTAAEIAGDITYGTEAMEVQHPGEETSRRVYRALRFQGTAGDKIEAVAIGGNAADPVLYLLGSNFQTLKSNDNSGPDTKSSKITTTLSRTGTHYLAFRTKEGWRTKFYVSLRKTNGAVEPPPPPPPPEPEPTEVDLFSDAVAGQTTLPKTQLAALFSPGASEANLGEFVLVERTRNCNGVTGCGAFSAITKIADLNVPARNDYTTWWENVEMPTGAAEIRGTTKLATDAAGKILLSFKATSQGKVELNPTEVGMSGWLGTTAQYCQKLGVYPPRNGCYGYGYLHEIGPSGKTARFSTLATKDYVYGRTSTVKSDVGSSGSYSEAQYAFIAPTAKAKKPSVRIAGETVFAGF